uniref:Uncharacterized protein n=1 Tax=Zea mays TaxID=4577 RepID=C0PKB0_MAIZE|nr:unknown [Zea mays]
MNLSEVVPKRLYHQLATLVLIILTKYIPLNLRRCLLNFLVSVLAVADRKSASANL